MKIAFVSTRGIPNNYGGFEQFAEYISVGLAKRGHDVTVYSPKYHPYQKEEYKGVHIRHIYSPEKWMGGSVGSFFYDFACLRDALKRGHFDIIYEAGYTSIIPAYIWFDVKKIKSPIFTTNMDGLEFKRSKFNKWVQKFIHWEEKEAVKYSHYLIADNMGIRDYYKEVYGKESKFLAYGANIYDDYDEKHLESLGLHSNGYYLLIARLEPENNVRMAIEGYKHSGEYGRKPLVIVGKTTTKHAKELLAEYGDDPSIRFVGGIYDFNKLNSIRHFSYAYFHGHSVGGTNPSLLEAMAAGCFILAHDNIFNRAVLRENATYYGSAKEVSDLLNHIEENEVVHRQRFVNENLEVIRKEYSWDHLVDQHEEYFKWLLEQER
ncbi:MAG TPA: glycosyl transferase [Prevotella sp.]|nr:glycosyl transferase [Prevotella sp.]